MSPIPESCSDIYTKRRDVTYEAPHFSEFVTS
jgi:hypothetical protein